MDLYGHDTRYEIQIRDTAQIRVTRYVSTKTRICQNENQFPPGIPVHLLDTVVFPLLVMHLCLDGVTDSASDFQYTGPVQRSRVRVMLCSHFFFYSSDAHTEEAMFLLHLYFLNYQIDILGLL